MFHGGERRALENLSSRLMVEAAEFTVSSYLPSYLPNRCTVKEIDLLCPPKSLSPDLRFGALSIRRYYWSVMDAYKVVQNLGPTKGVSV